MRIRRILVSVGVVVLGASLLVGAPAQAEPVWTPAERFDGVRVAAVNAAGRSVVIATSRLGLRSTFRTTGGRWTEPERVVGRGVGGRLHDVVIDRRGNVAAAWVKAGHCDEDRIDSDFFDDFEVVVAYRPRGRDWRHRTLPGEWGMCSGSAPELAVDRDGTVTAVWRGDHRLLVSQRTVGTPWTRPKPIRGARGRLAGIGAIGDATTVVWSGDAGLESSTSSAIGRWSPPELSPAGGGGAGALWPVAMGAAASEITVVGLRRLEMSGKSDIVVHSRSVDGWVEPSVIASTEDVHPRSVDYAASGATQTVVWVRDRVGDDSAQHVMATTREPAGGWAPPTTVSGAIDARASVELHVAATRTGVLAVWNHESETERGLRSSYRPRGGAWQPSEEQTPSPSHALEILANPAGVWTLFVESRWRGSSRFIDLADDTSAPSAHVRKFSGRPAMGGRLKVTWRASDDLLGVADMDVRVRSAGRDGHWSRWSLWRDSLNRFSAVRTVAAGRTYCFSVRARDRAGNVGRWSGFRCAVTPVDDRTARATAGWTRLRRERAYNKTLTVAARRGQRLVLPGVRARAISLVARSCQRCGVVAVSHGGRDLGRVDLASEKIRNKRVYPLRTYPSVRRGRLVVRVLSRGKPVQVDALVAKR